MDRLFHVVNAVEESFIVHEEVGWFYTTARPFTPTPRYVSRYHFVCGGPLPLKEMAATVSRAAAADRSTAFLVDAPDAAMVQTDFVWELVEVGLCPYAERYVSTTTLGIRETPRYSGVL